MGHPWSSSIYEYSVMEPVLQRLGDVTIQRLERPKDPKQDPPSASSNQKEAQKPAEENEDSDEL